MIHCASLAYIESGKVLLVRVRENTLWYFPGGKVAVGETPSTALIRELSEELNINVKPADIRFLTEITGPNHDGSDTVRLYIYTLDELPPCRPGSEVREIRWFTLLDENLMAPAVIKTLKALNNGL
ncbi:NUDIX domain-containing protein [Gibbsiella greigii]